IAKTIEKKKSPLEFVGVYILSHDDSKALQIASSKLIHIQQHLLVLQDRRHGRMMTKQSDKTLELLSYRRDASSDSHESQESVIRLLKDALGICELQEYVVSLEKLMRIDEIQNAMASIPDPSINNASSTTEPRGPGVQPKNMQDITASVTRSIEIPIKNISDFSSNEPVINGKIVRRLYYRQQQVAQKFLGQ
ncbi:11792_t:CDS:2, partial [Paraglomus brasilianum]